MTDRAAGNATTLDGDRPPGKRRPRPGAGPPGLRLKELISRKVVTVSPEASLRELAEILESEEISGVPVLAGTRVVGVVSATDLLRFESEGSAEPAGLDEARERAGLEGHTVSEVMTRTPFTLTPDSEVHEAAEYMVRAGVHRLLVTRNLELVGIVTATDILRAVAERRL